MRGSYFCNFTHKLLTWSFNVLSIIFAPWLMNALQVLPQTPPISRKFSQHYNDSEMFSPHVLTCYSSSRQQKDDEKKPTCIHRQVQGIWFRRQKIWNSFSLHVYFFPNWRTLKEDQYKINYQSCSRVLLKLAWILPCDAASTLHVFFSVTVQKVRQQKPQSPFVLCSGIAICQESLAWGAFAERRLIRG